MILDIIARYLGFYDNLLKISIVIVLVILVTLYYILKIDKTIDKVYIFLIVYLLITNIYNLI